MSLKRELEPEVMDTPEEAIDYNSMDHSSVNRLFVDDLLATDWYRSQVTDDDVLMDLLDLGTGTALIPVELCEASSNCRVMAVDMATHMLDLARYNIEAGGWIERIELAQVDAKAMEFEDGQFDAVISNSIVHHIPEPRLCLGEAVRVTRPGGLLFFRDLMRPGSEEQVRHLVQEYAGEENEHQQKMFDDSLRAALSLEEIQELVGECGFDPSTVEATSDRHWTWVGVKGTD